MEIPDNKGGREDAQAPPSKTALLNLFLVSAFLIAFETCLTRYFSITLGNEYAYLIISIVMVGIALSGVLLSLFEKFFARRQNALLSFLPLLLVLAGLAGMYLITRNDFNPLALQHEVTWKSQLFNLLAFYLELIPVFFLAGIFIGLNFVAYSGAIGRVYACNLLGSAAGAVAVLWLMFIIHPFYLLAGVLPLLFIPAVLSLIIYPKRFSKATMTAAILLLALAEILAVKHPFGGFPYFKQVYASLNIQDNRVVEEKFSPAGYYLVLDNLAEFNSIDLTNNYESLGIGPPPRAAGVYKDGQHIVSLMAETPDDFSYLQGALTSFPYQLKTRPAVMLVGTVGGFRIQEVERYFPARLVALEPDPVIFDLVKNSSALKAALVDPQTVFLDQSPFSWLAAHPEKFDIIEISPDLLFQNPVGAFFFTREAVASYLQALNPGGIILFQIPISEFSGYALKMFETARAALKQAGASQPEQQLLVYRSTWTAAILISNQRFDSELTARLQSFCRERSFDSSYFPGIDPSKVEIFNDLPALSFDSQSVAESSTASDSLMTQILELLNAGRLQDSFFNLQPTTLDRPAFFSMLKLSRFRQIFGRLSIIPQEEIGNIINLVVLPQALLFALLILILPLARARSIPSFRLFLKTACYFACIGLAYLFIEMALINRFNFFLNDASSAFALVLTGMLVFSGVGSWLSERKPLASTAGLRMPVSVIIAMLVFYILALPKITGLAMDQRFAVKGILMVICIAPAALAMGYFFPLGITSVRKSSPFLVPWAWAVNGAFSVISTPLANLLSLRAGFTSVFLASLLFYAAAFISFPKGK